MESVADNRAILIGGITLSDPGGSRRTRAEPPLCAPVQVMPNRPCGAQEQALCKPSSHCAVLAIEGVAKDEDKATLVSNRHAFAPASQRARVHFTGLGWLVRQVALCDG